MSYKDDEEQMKRNIASLSEEDIKAKLDKLLANDVLRYAEFLKKKKGIFIPSTRNDAIRSLLYERGMDNDD